jgi:high-affinity nickel permease
VTNPTDKYNTPPKTFWSRVGPAFGWMALAVVIGSIIYCGVTQKDIHEHKEGWSAVIIIAFILVGLILVGIIHVRRKS